MPDLPQLNQVEALFFSHAPQLFGLCYLHAAGPQGAYRLLHTLLCDLLTSPRQWQLAKSGTAGLFRCAQQVCMDQSLKRPRRKKKPAQPAAPAPTMPFSMTDGLRAILKLPAPYKAPLYLRLGLGWSAAETAKAVGVSPARVDKLVRRGLARAKSTEEKARALLMTLAPPPLAPQQVWDAFLVDQSDKGFAGMQRLRRFKRWLDNAVPYMALGAVALCVFAYYGVEWGWFNGQGYVATVPMAGYTSSELAAAPRGELPVFVPEGGGLVQYTVTGAPRTYPALIKEMVALGGAPEGTSLLSVEHGPVGQMKSPSPVIEAGAGALSLELSAECGQWFAGAPGSSQRDMLRAMVLTVQAACGPIEELHFYSGGQEITVEGAAIQDLLAQKAEPLRTVSTPYLE